MPEKRSGRATPVDTNELDIISVIKEKFEELEADLLSEIKELINLEVEKAMKKQKEEFKSAIDTLQERVTNLEHAHDDLEQYGRRQVYVWKIYLLQRYTCYESADNVLEKVENILKEECSNLSGNVIDRAHLIGSNYKCFKTNNTYRSFIVRFNSFKHRTLFYRNRNKLKGVRIKLDLTKKRYNVLRSARSSANENQDINYVFADINCRLKVAFKNGTSDFFKDIIELNELIEKYMS